MPEKQFSSLRDGVVDPASRAGDQYPLGQYPLGKYPLAGYPGKTGDRVSQVTGWVNKVHRFRITMRKHWWVVVLCVAVTLTPATWYAFQQPHLHVSTGKVWFSGRVNIQEGKLFAEEWSNFLGTQADLLRSSTIYQRALARLLQQHPEWPVPGSAVAANLEIPPVLDLVVRESPRSAVFLVQATSSFADASRRFVDLVMEEFLSFRREFRAQSSDVTMTNLTEQVVVLGEQLRTEQDRLHDFLTTNNVVFVQEQGTSAASYLGKISQELAEARKELQLLERLGKKGSSTEEAVAETSDTARLLLGENSEYSKVSQELMLARARHADLGEFLRPAHPKMAQLAADIASKERLLGIVRSQSLEQLGERRQTILARIENLQTVFTEWEGKALDASRRMALYQRIQQEVARVQSAYERLLGVSQNVDVSKNLDQEMFQIMERASPPRTTTRSVRYMIFGLIGGLVASFIILAFLERFDDRFTSIAELNELIPEVIAGHIPRIRGLNSDNKSGSGSLIKTQDERHALVEAFRNLRSWILYMSGREKAPKVILITSSVPGEGKSTISSNLAITLATAGAKVLLIDADLRRGTVAQRFGLKPKCGLCELLQQQVRLADTVCGTAYPTLTLLPAGGTVVDVGELFLLPSTDLLLREVRAQYDFVIFDSAPILATDDTSTLAPKVDGVLFVVRSHFSRARMALEAMALLEARKVKIFGLVYNCATASISDPYYYRYRGYYYQGYDSYRRPKPSEKPPVARNGESEKEPQV